jgi:hypothetical protein
MITAILQSLSMAENIDPEIIALAVIDCIEQTLPTIVEDLELPAEMSSTERKIQSSRLEQRPGFRRYPKSNRAAISDRLRQETNRDSFRIVRRQIQSTDLSTDLANVRADFIGRDSSTSTSGKPASASSSSVFVASATAFSHAGEPARPRARTATDCVIIPEDIDADAIRQYELPDDSDDQHSRLHGSDIREKFAIIFKGRVMRLSSTAPPAGTMPSGSEQVRVPNDDVYKFADSSNLLRRYTYLGTLASSNPAIARETRLIEALLDMLELEEQWENINRRRFHLITKKHLRGLRRQESDELDRLQTLAKQRADVLHPLPGSTAELLLDYSRRAGLLDESL